ncbi:MAG: hypothetical protein ACW99U_17780 [Candidatus Thorarchaeota archaeon]|jgi:hypothetical protein
MTVKKAIYNAGQTGRLPDLAVSRNLATADDLGNAVAANTARYGAPIGKVALEEWSAVATSQPPLYYFGNGTTHLDGTGKILLAYDVNRVSGSHFQIYIDKEVDGSPTCSVDFYRLGAAADRDLALLTPDDYDADYSYAPSDIIAIPGCFLIYATRYYDDGGFDEYQTAVFALHVDKNGVSNVELVGNCPNVAYLDSYTRFSLAINALNVGYPNPEENPPLDAFCVINDYVSDSGKWGGQLCIFRATRADKDSMWSFQAIYEIKKFESAAVAGDHYHSSCWLRNGVIVARGDGPADNKMEYHHCSDWDNYTDSGSWSEQIGQGHDSDDDTDGSQSDQFCGSLTYPGNPHKCLIGSDLIGAAIGIVREPEDPLNDGGVYISTPWGCSHAWKDRDRATSNPWAASPGPANWCVFRMKQQTPWRGPGQDLMYAELYGGTSIQQIENLYESGRILVARDPELWAPASLWIRDSDYTNHGTYIPYGDKIICFPYTAEASSTTYELPIGDIRSIRPLLISPGGTNHLTLSGGDLRNTNLYGGPTNVAELVTADPYTGKPLDAPGLGPVYHFKAWKGDASQRLFYFKPQGTDAWVDGMVFTSFWIKLINVHAYQPIEMCYDATQANKFGANATIAERDHWVKRGSLHRTDEWATHTADLTHYFYENNQGTDPRFWEALIQFEGHWDSTEINGQTHPYPMAPSTVPVVGPAEEITQSLDRIDTPEYSIAMCFHIPEDGVDWTRNLDPYGATYETYKLVTIYGDDDNYIEIQYQCGEVSNDEAQSVMKDEIQFLVNSGGALVDTLIIPVIQLNRKDTLYLGCSFDHNGDISAFASHGSRYDGHPALDSYTGVLETRPTAIRFGNVDFSEVNSMACSMVAVDYDTAFTTPAEFAALLNNDREDKSARPAEPPEIIEVVDLVAAPTASTTTQDITVAEGESLIAVCNAREVDTEITTDGYPMVSVVWDQGGGENFLKCAEEYNESMAFEGAIAIWVLPNPTAGSGTVTATWPGTCSRVGFGLIKVKNLDKANPVDTSVTETTPAYVDDIELSATVEHGVLAVLGIQCVRRAITLDDSAYGSTQHWSISMAGQMAFCTSSPKRLPGTKALGGTYSLTDERHAAVMVAFKGVDKILEAGSGYAAAACKTLGVGSCA